MIDLETLRRLLQQPTLPDDEVIAIRAAFTKFARLILEQYVATRSPRSR